MSADPAAADAPWTVARVLEWTTGHLRKLGIPNPRIETEILLAHARGCKRIDLYVHYDAPLSNAERAQMRELVKRRAQHEPVAYLVGTREFFSLEFRVTPAVLIPRPETETLVLELITLAKDLSRPAILDLGTGSGCIAIAAAIHLKTAQLTAVDLSPEALAIAGENAARHDVADRIDLVEGDLFESFPVDRRWNLIASNPPYIGTEELDELPPDIRLHEPLRALEAGPGGLAVFDRIIAAAPDHLEPGGWLLLEFDPAQLDPLTDRLTRRGFADLRPKKDSGGTWRVLMARWPG